jgi:hypothetical protein
MSETLLIERYKYVLSQKKSLNETTFKVAAFFQAVMLVVLGAQFRIIELAQKNEIAADLARIGSWGLFWATCGLAAVALLLLIGGIASWFDYRREESCLEEQFGIKVRKPPSFRSFFRWYETYIGLMFVVVALVYFCALQYVILPTLA